MKPNLTAAVYAALFVLPVLLAAGCHQPAQDNSAVLPSPAPRAPASAANPGKAPSPSTDGPASGSKLAPGFNLTAVSGGKISLASLKGKVVLLDFWATWCVPCRKELPDIQALNARYHKRGLQVLGLVEPPKEGIKQLIQASKLTFPNLYTDDNTIAQYAAQAPPLTILIDRKGAIVRSESGLPADGALAFWQPILEKALAKS